MISIVIPLYNKAHTIVNTLSSVFAQTYMDYEVVIVDDGSTDKSVQVIEEHFDDIRIRIIQQENKGVSVARNRGVDESKGDYVAFLDGDDEWHPEYLQTMVELIRQYPTAGLFLCGGKICDQTGIYWRVAAGYENYMGKIDLFQNPQVFIHTSATIVNKYKFNQTHRFVVGMKKYEDFLAILALALRTDTIYCGLPITKYNGGIDGQLTQMNRNNPQIVESEILFYNSIVDDFYSTPIKNTTFPIYLKYILRHEFKLMLLNKQTDKQRLYLSGLSNKVKSFFFALELWLYRNSILITRIWVNLTKIIWRRHRFPYVGERIDVEKFPNRYIQW